MTINDCVAKAQKYLSSDDTQVRFICCDNSRILAEFKQQVNIGSVKMIESHRFSKKDELPGIDSLIHTLQNEASPVMASGFFTSWKLLGEEELSDRVMQLVQFSKCPCHTLFLCHQPGKILNFSDPRYSRLVWKLDGEPDNKSELIFVDPQMPEFLSCPYVDGIHMISEIVLGEACHEKIAVKTQKLKHSFASSLLPISEQGNSFEALCEMDLLTEKLKESYGKAEQWQSALKHMSKHKSWERYVCECFGSSDNMGMAFGTAQKGDEEIRWLYFIALKLFGGGNNLCLKYAAEHSENESQLIREIYRSILVLDVDSKEFAKFYGDRKSLLELISNHDEEALDFCAIVAASKEKPLQYLTDCSRVEREKIISMLSEYATEENRQEVMEILKSVYPALYSYLLPFNFGNEKLNRYFDEYKYEKLINRIFPDFELLVTEQSEKREYNSILPPRTEVVERLDKTGSCLYFVDAMGVEYLGYIIQKCSELKLSANVTVCRCELPSLTFCNKDFVEDFGNVGITAISIKKLDDIKHHGEENFDYTRDKLPTHLIRELEIIDEILSSVRTNLRSGKYSKAFIISDHGASRLAVIKEHTLNIDVNSKGSHGGRVCSFTDDVSEVPCAARAGEYYVLANYDRFKGGRPASVETHGGATLEELTVPVIELSIAPENVEISILTPEITISFRKKAEIRFFSNTRLNDVSVLVGGIYYSAEYDGNSYVVKMPDIKKSKQYTADVYSGSSCIASGLTFTVKKEGASEKEFF